MGLTMHEKKSLTLEVARRYRKAKKKEKSRMLDEFVATTRYNRVYASWLLSNRGREISRRLRNGDKLLLVKEPRRKRTRKRPPGPGREEVTGGRLKNTRRLLTGCHPAPCISASTSSRLADHVFPRFGTRRRRAIFILPCAGVTGAGVTVTPVSGFARQYPSRESTVTTDQ